ncbi:hypothetical protein HHL28_13765 [Aerophototrophica crusticola]|uniref:Uncharacterized protein n=1 Tax=Aerophototrophica crusticola TaxID=1709002 RepID=A0A858RAK1_9PROT|nr:hypothetical protein HHL28_13765 [Rhodospirillaceae bacterium B3]
MDGYLCPDGLDTESLVSTPLPAPLAAPDTPAPERHWMVYQSQGFAVMVEWEG